MIMKKTDIYMCPEVLVIECLSQGVMCGSINNGFDANTGNGSDEGDYGYETFPW